MKDQHVNCALTTPALLSQHTGHVGDARIAQAPAQIGLVPHRHHGRTGPADEAFVKNDVLLNRVVVFFQVVVADPALPAIRTLNLCSFASTGNDFADHKRIVAANMHHIAGLKHWQVSRDHNHPSLLHCAAKFAGCDKLGVDLLNNMHVGFGCTAGLDRLDRLDRLNGLDRSYQMCSVLLLSNQCTTYLVPDNIFSKHHD